jgi:hypothetical protein
LFLPASSPLLLEELVTEATATGVGAGVGVVVGVALMRGLAWVFLSPEASALGALGVAEEVVVVATAALELALGAGAEGVAACLLVCCMKLAQAASRS